MKERFVSYFVGDNCAEIAIKINKYAEENNCVPVSVSVLPSHFEQHRYDDLDIADDLYTARYEALVVFEELEG